MTSRRMPITGTVAADASVDANRTMAPAVRAESAFLRGADRPVPAPRVSVVIIFLNAEKYLREAVESVFAQTYADWELLLVDDGSTDGGTAIARDYATRQPGRVFYLEHEGHRNRGMSASRNLGIAHARGEFVAMLDADDVWLPDKLAKQVAILDRHADVGMVVGPALYWYADGTKSPQRMALPDGRMGRGEWLPRILESDDNAACPSSVLMRRSLALELDGFEASFEGPLMMVEDQVMWFKTNLAAPVYHHPECLLLYRIHLASCCNATPPEQHLHIRQRLYAWLACFLDGPGRRFAPPPQLGIIVRSRLCDVLLQLARQPVNGQPRGRWARLWANAALACSHRKALGATFALVVLLDGVWARAAAAVSRRRLARAAGQWQRP
jgi:GT2 family glycosyltransferase